MFLKTLRKSLSRIPIRLRLSLIFVVFVGVTTVLFNMFVFKMSIDNLQQDFDDALLNYSVAGSEGVDIGGKGNLNFQH